MQHQAPQKNQQNQNMSDPKKAQNIGHDDDMVGKDTDGDGKVVKPGQKPGQSHGKGLPNS
ncbi:MAG: hypothetical protein IT562_13065 [Alphaproteobacteria bacterium]|nr:hypothetical protein [Alphaproteobacteria bacterium]